MDERAERAVAPRAEPPPVASRSEPPVTPRSEPPVKGASRSPMAGKVVELDSATYDPGEHRARTDAPRRLHIGDLAIDAPVRAVGVAADDTMEIPGPADVGWYRFGAAPGEDGAVVLAGHIAFDGVDGAFRKLSEIELGTRVEITMQDGASHAYAIERVDTYRKEVLPAAVWAKQGPERLVLITCGETFDPERRSYESNVVAIATPVSER